MNRIIIKRLMLVVFGVISVLVALECCLRLMPHTSGPNPLGDRSQFLYMPDENHAHVWSAGGPTNDVRIAVIEDSFAEGRGIQEDDRYANRLEHLLNMKTGLRDVEVRVFAKCGTSTFQQISLLDEALKFKSDIVILGICLNDMEDWGNPRELDRWRTPLMPQIPPAWIARPLSCSKALIWIYCRIEQIMAHQNELRYYRRLYKPAYSGVNKFREALALMNDKCRAAHVAFERSAECQDIVGAWCFMNIL